MDDESPPTTSSACRLFHGPHLVLTVGAEQVTIIWTSPLRRLLHRPRHLRLPRRAIAAVVLCPWGGALLVQLQDGQTYTLVLGADAAAAYAALQP